MRADKVPDTKDDETFRQALNAVEHAPFHGGRRLIAQVYPEAADDREELHSRKQRRKSVEGLLVWVRQSRR
jgi:hypothetical protein